MCNLTASAQPPLRAYWPSDRENAKKIAAVALSEAKKNNWYMAVAAYRSSLMTKSWVASAFL